MFRLLLLLFCLDCLLLSQTMAIDVVMDVDVDMDVDMDMDTMVRGLLLLIL